MDFSWLYPHIPDGVAPWAYFLCVGLAVLITGISKAGFGGGVGILSIPLLALVVGPKDMLGLTLPLLIACDILSNLHHIGHYDWKRLTPLLSGAVGGVILGTLVLAILRSKPPAEFDQVMNIIVGGVCLGVVLLQAYRLTGRSVPTLPPHPLSAASVGCFAGTVSTINNSAGPIISVYLLQEKLEKRIFVGTQLLYFLLINLAKVPTYLFLPMADGQPIINARTLLDSIWFIPLIPVGTLMGAWMHHRVPEKPFEAILYSAAGIAAIDLLCKAILGHSALDIPQWTAMIGHG